MTTLLLLVLVDFLLGVIILECRDLERAMRQTHRRITNAGRGTKLG